MLEKLLLAQTTKEFMQVSRLLASGQSRLELFNEISSQDVVLSSDDLWTAEDMSQFSSGPKAISKALSLTDQEENEAKLVHRLQLVAGCNPGAKRAIESFLARACV